VPTIDLIAYRHLSEVDRRIGRLMALRGELDRMISECDQGRVGECRVIETLSNHGKCSKTGRPHLEPRRSSKPGPPLDVIGGVIVSLALSARRRTWSSAP